MREAESGVSNSRPGGEWARHASTKWDWTLWPCRTTFGSCSVRLSPLRSVRPIPPPSPLPSRAADLDGVEVPLPATPDSCSPRAILRNIRGFTFISYGGCGGGFLCSRIIVTVTRGDRKDSPIIRALLGERSADRDATNVRFLNAWVWFARVTINCKLN